MTIPPLPLRTNGLKTTKILRVNHLTISNLAVFLNDTEIWLYKFHSISVVLIRQFFPVQVS